MCARAGVEWMQSTALLRVATEKGSAHSAALWRARPASSIW
jgi:hypothetical protein